MPDSTSLNVGQIIYNLKDYRNQYNYMSTSNSNITQILYSNSINKNADCSIAINSSASSNYKKIDIYDENLIGKSSPIGVEKIKKLGVQAPAGTKFIINGDKEIMVGRTGIYELDDSFEVNKLQFIRPLKYILDKNSTDSALQNGVEQLRTARNNFDIAVSEIMAEENTSEYWKEYNTCYVNYMREYQEAYALFLQGVNGIYMRPNPDNPNAEENFDDLINIIIDFLY